MRPYPLQFNMEAPGALLVSPNSEVRAAKPRSLWTDEGMSGICLNELTAKSVHRAAGALASCLADQRNNSRPKIIVAGDGRALAVELISAAAEAVRWAGCDVLELGNAWSGSVAMAIQRFNAIGGLLVGNVSSDVRTASVSFFGGDGAPWSFGGSLNAVQTSWEGFYSRPVRTSGSSARISIDTEYRALFADDLPLEQPLRIVLDSACGPLFGWMRQLLPSTCQWISPQPLPLPKLSNAKPMLPRATLRERRERAIARQVVATTADFGIWIDGIGEACTVIDDRGLTLPPTTLVALLSRSPFDETDVSCESFENVTRETAFQRFAESTTQIAGDEQGRVWFRTADGMPQLDALRTVMRLLKILNETSQPMRKLVDCLAI